MTDRRIFHTRARLAAGGAALALAAGGAAAYAAGAATTHASAARGAIASAIAGDLGISTSELRADLAAGQTLAQIAAANNQSLSGLEQTILTAVQGRLDQAVAAGKLTSGQESALLGRLGARIDRLVNVGHPALRLRLALRRMALVRFAARYLGLTPKELRADLRSGTTLAQLAGQDGKTAAELEQAIESAVGTRLDKAVSAGLISAQREQTMLASLQTRLDTLVNRSL
jgi:hypothetical protein